MYICNQVWPSLLHYQTRGGGDSSRVLENSESPVGFIVQMFVSEQQSIFYTFQLTVNPVLQYLLHQNLILSFLKKQNKLVEIQYSSHSQK